MTRLLFVCLGNICRSPLMEGVVRARLAEVGRAQDFHLDSAGLGDWHAGEAPDPRTIVVARRHGIDISAQRARGFVDEDYQRFDRILCADLANLEVLQRRAPANAIAECALFLDWTGVQASGEVPDPYTGTARDFEIAFALIDRGAGGLLKRFASLS